MASPRRRAVSLGVGVGAPVRLGDDLVDDAQGLLLARRQAHRHRGLAGGLGGAPQDARAALGRDDRVDGVLERQDDVADRDGQGAAGAALARDDGHDRRAQLVIRAMLRAMASAWPRSSEGASGAAPGVSTKVTTGRPSRSARRIRRVALR